MEQYSYEILACIVFALVLLEIIILKLPTKEENTEDIAKLKIIKNNFLYLTQKHKDFIIASIYVSSGLLFSLYIRKCFGSKEMLDYLSGFAIEFMLSIDNLFMIMLIFKSFDIKSSYHKKLVLLVGLISAIIMRFVIIYTSVETLLEVSWMMTLFALFVIFIGLKLLFQKANHKQNFRQNKIFLFFQRKFNIQESDQNFFIKNAKNQTKITTLFVCLVLIELTDLIFALDSVPAILLITQNIFIVYSANIFAILGLRSFYNIIELFLGKLHYINKIIGFILILLGFKIII